MLKIRIRWILLNRYILSKIYYICLYVRSMDFETFINKFSFVNSNFVKDFYNIIKEDYIERYNEFLIDSEILRKWLQINTKQQFNNTIKKSYKKNVDYIINKIKKTPGSGGHNLEVITLTPEAAKKI
jgi:hypothetical protein